MVAGGAHGSNWHGVTITTTWLALLVAGCPGTAWESPDPCDASEWFADADGDGHGDPARSVAGCVAPAGHVADGDDCDDGRAAVHPGAVEACNGVDDDCDGKADEDDDPVAFYRDGDGDGFGVDGEVEYAACGPPEGFAAEAGDCDDGDAAVYPGAEDVPCDGIDTDCDGAGGDAATAAIDGAEYVTIQDAIDAATDGDTVHICPGRHPVRLEVPAMTLTLASLSGDPESTILDGEHSHPMLVVADGAMMTIEELCFEHGRVDESSCKGRYDGGAIRSYAEHLALSGCVFRENSVETEPPANSVYGASVSALRCGAERLRVEVVDCLFERNGCESDHGGTVSNLEVSCSGVEALDECLPEVRVVDSSFQGNTGGGAGIRVKGWSPAHVTIQHSEFVGNTDEDDGSAVTVGAAHSIGGSAVVEDCLFQDNQMRSLSLGNLENRVERSMFVGNTSGSGAGGLSLGASSWVADSLFMGNHAVGDAGGAIHVGASSETNAVNTTVFDGCEIVDNLADLRGGAVEIWARFDDLEVEFLDTLIEGNEAPEGGGIWVKSDGGHASLTVDGGAVRDNEGGGLAFEDRWGSGTLLSDHVDWGAEQTDNETYDVDTGVRIYSGMVAGEQWVCEAQGTCVTP